MSYGNTDPYEWFRRFFGGSGIPRASRQGGDIFGELDSMTREMERMYEEQFKDIQSTAPKELVREYETSEGEKVREIGPIVYGYSVTIGPDGKPKVREFGNVKSPSSSGSFGASRPQISAEREPLADVIDSDKEVKVVVELPGVNRENIKVNALEGSVEISADTPERKYHRILDIPSDVDINSVKSTFNNGILEIIFAKKGSPKGKQINID
jgi:HSP20 family protein